MSIPKKPPKNLQPLIDADVLRYELPFGGEYKEEGEIVVREWEFVEELLERKLHILHHQIRTDKVPIYYFTADRRTIPIYNRWAKNNGKEPIELKPNFRDAIATVKPYKALRKNEKPAHYENFTSHIMYNYEFKLGNGVEADDLMAMDQTEDTIICSRDKDLRQVEGWHYSWECGRQNEIGPIYFDEWGFIEEKRKESKSRVYADGSPKFDVSCFGGGEKFFLYQLLTGDLVDNIPGCPKVGHRKAFDLLEPHSRRDLAYEDVRDCYELVYDEDWLERLEEQARLLWLIRHEGEVWEHPYER